MEIEMQSGFMVVRLQMLTSMHLKEGKGDTTGAGYNKEMYTYWASSEDPTVQSYQNGIEMATDHLPHNYSYFKLTEYITERQAEA